MTNLAVNYQQMWRFIWKDDAGAPGQSFACWPVNLPAIGTRITVYADPDGNIPSVWEGDCGTR